MTAYYNDNDPHACAWLRELIVRDVSGAYEMKTKLFALKKAHAEGDLIGALRIAARFPQLGKHRDAIKTAWDAHNNPRFYREIGKDPETLFHAGIAAIEERYSL